VIIDGELWYIDSTTGNTLTSFDIESDERHSTKINNVLSFFIFDDIISVYYVDSGSEYSVAAYSLKNGENVSLFGER
jgi:hypothetical protein